MLNDCFSLAFQNHTFIAYIDPNTGGILMQYLVPVFVALGAGWVFLKDKVSDAVARVFRRWRRA